MIVSWRIYHPDRRGEMLGALPDSTIKDARSLVSDEIRKGAKIKGEIPLELLRRDEEGQLFHVMIRGERDEIAECLKEAGVTPDQSAA